MSETNWNIRQANSDDIPALVEFNCGIARETEDKELDHALVTRGVTRALEQGDEVKYFVAESESSPIGSLMLTREWSDWRDGWMVWIQSVYVAANYRGKGVFRALLDHATKSVNQDPDVRGLRLYVENDNTRAQSVYASTGFADPHYKVLEKLLN